METVWHKGIGIQVLTFRSLNDFTYGQDGPSSIGVACKTKWLEFKNVLEKHISTLQNPHNPMRRLDATRNHNRF